MADWLALAAVVLMCLPMLLTGIDQRLSSHTMENVAIVVSQETFLRVAAGEPLAWLVCTNDGQPRLEKPPMLTWLNLLAWCDLDAATASPGQLIFRARCVSVALGLMLLASVFLIGRMLGDLRLAILAAVAIAATFFFQRQARTASYDMHYVAWTTLAVALALWAMNPLAVGTSRVRRIIGWGGCALALTCAVMSKNPLPYLLGVPPLIAAIVLLSGRRRQDAAWLASAVAFSMLLAGAWYVHVFIEYPEHARRALAREVTQPRETFQPVWYYLGLFGLVVPWTVWLIGSLVEPFHMRDRARKRAAMMALIWFAVIFIGMSIPGAKQQRYILGILPAVGLLLAMFFRQHDDRVGRGERDARFNVIAAGHWIVLTALSVLVPLGMASQDWIIAHMRERLGDSERVIATPAWPIAAAVALALVMICVQGWRWHERRPWHSAIATSLWMVVLMTVFWRQEAGHADELVLGFVEESARLRSIVGDAPLRSLRITDDDKFMQFNEEFRIYYGRLIPRVLPDEIDRWLESCDDRAFVLARESEEASRLLGERGFVANDIVRIDRRELHTLWRRPAAIRN